MTARRILRHWSLLLLIAPGVVQLRAATREPEYQVKAAFVYKFATYVRWPPRAGVDATTPFVIGVLGNDPFDSSLAEVVRGQIVQGREIRIRTLSRVEDVLSCDLVFVCASERKNLERIFAVLRGAPVLTIGDIEQFAEQGGMIGLVTTPDNHIRFDINKAAVDRSGLQASSQLLHLARIVDERRGERGRR